MAKFDQGGGGCPCGLYRECPQDCEHSPCSTHDLCRRLRRMAGAPRVPKAERALLIEAADALDRARHVAVSEPELANLRTRVETVDDRDAITAWLNEAEALGIDPL